MPGSPRISKLSVQVLTQAKARERARIIAKRNLFIHILFLIDMCISEYLWCISMLFTHRLDGVSNKLKEFIDTLNDFGLLSFTDTINENTNFLDVTIYRGEQKLVRTQVYLGIGSKGSNEYEVNDVIKDLFVYCSNDDSGTETGFTAIKSSINYYQFLLNDFFYIISSGNGTLQQTNVILGTIRLRQLRVRSDTCHVHKSFSRVRNKCYPYYSPDVESTKMFGRDMKWRYSPPKHSYTERYKFGTYHSGGFQVELDPSSTTLLVDLYGMVKNKWIDHYTSTIFIELFTYNPSLDLFTSIK
ncbi:hypothetical protein GJ496_010791 [Pomphorhynchus laevis]|nr:hypothetical protein GJ496_010791 [Pomphorhynchus laevis]